MSDTAKHICREICAYKGEPSCHAIDALTDAEWRPCEVCEPAAAWHDAEIAALKHDIARYVAAASDHAAEVERLEREADAEIKRLLIERLERYALDEDGEIELDREDALRAARALRTAPGREMVVTDAMVEAAFYANHNPLAEMSDIERRKTRAGLEAALRASLTIRDGWQSMEMAKPEHRLPEIGDKMRFINCNGYEGERQKAAKAFSTEQVVTVSSVSVGSWSTSLQFDEVEGRWNSVMFDFASPTQGASE